MQVPKIDRRQALMKTAALFGAALTPGLAGALTMVTDAAAAPVAKPFTAEERATVAAVSERIIPTTDTPGAIGAGVPDFIEMMLGDFYEPQYRDEFIAGVRALNEVSRARHGQVYSNLSPEQQDALLTEAEAGRLPQLGKDFFNNAKQLTVTGYYSSEVGMTQERVYLPVPGKYDGDYPYEKVGTLFTG